jgi:hypothetical protein
MSELVTITGQIINRPGDNGLTVDYCSLAADFKDSDLLNKIVNIRYWISDTDDTPDIIKERYLKTLMGVVDVDYGYIYYSEITGGQLTAETLTIGGHDLLKELATFNEKYVLLEIEIVPAVG